jgi:hypothetical protein
MVPQAASEPNQGTMGIQGFGDLDFGGQKDSEIHMYTWQEKVFSEVCSQKFNDLDTWSPCKKGLSV